MNSNQINALWRGIQGYRGTPCVKCLSRDTWPNVTRSDSGQLLLHISCDNCWKVTSTPLPLQTRNLAGL
ncbi:hypothetical protein [Streptomyces sp. UNOC14_S4]|uniref:hypothetical protein n=1 Tax=Streptomyces sp. UNOC14_S4 TaxID=2872340 RepID=UPI000EF7E649|nr:hypothetical protein [Streptomyces sp. UNOC14_S4]MCC3769417.1 hypothetical protein [Streptomyces sp. UNOC14_S4]RLU92209.1 hypothetical protein CTZ27_20405 [Streptomyces griseocarneus]